MPGTQTYFACYDEVVPLAGAPDEFLPGTVLGLFGVDMNDDIWREVTAEFEFPPHESQRPIEWTSLWRPHAVGHVAADGEPFAGKLHRSLVERMLHQFIKRYRTGYGYGWTFFRKIFGCEWCLAF